MNRKTSFERFAAAFILAACLAALAARGQKPAKNNLPENIETSVAAAPNAPDIFSPNNISTGNNEFGGGISPDGKSFYFARSVPRSYIYAIFVSDFQNGGWTTPRIAPFSGRDRDFDAVFTPDGNRIYFVSDRRDDSEKPQLDYDLWFIERTTSGWSAPRRAAAPLNSAGNEWFASAAANGTLYLSSTRGNPPNNSDVYRVPRLADGSYGEPENLGDAVNTPGFETEAFVAPDESFIVFSSIRPGGFGDFDLYVSRRENGKWTKAENLGALVNTGARDYSPRLSPDGETLFFTSERNFSTGAVELKPTYRELRKNLRGLYNGLGNIYRIRMRSVIKPPDQ